MKRRTLIVTAATATAAVALAAGLAGAAQAGSSDDGSERPITGEALDAASRAALDHLGEGTVTDTEVDDEDSYYEVEVTLDSGRQVDVQLDRDFAVVATETDGAAGDDD